jgi:YidC/Oxa1 family membrane protein insertase
MYQDFIYKPLFNLIVYIQNVVPGHDFGLVIILLAFLIRLAFYPLTKKSLSAQTALNKIQPEIKKIQEQFKDNKEEQGRKMMELYKTHKVNPMSGCLPILVQLPIMIALYQILRTDIGTQLGLLYPFIKLEGTTSYLFLGLVNLALPNTIMAILAGVSQFYSTLLTFPQKQAKKETSKFDFQTQMKYISPLLTFFIALQLSSGLSLFWFGTNFFMVLQQLYMNKQKKVD